MEAQQVIEKILADARAEAEKIAKNAREKLAADQDDADSRLARYNEQTQALAQKAAKDEKDHLLAAARMKIAKEYLAEKRAILDEIFGQALRRMSSLEDDQYKALMAKRMLEAVETGDEEVIVDKSEKRIDHEFIKDINRKLGPGFQGNLRLASAKADLAGAGFILKRGKVKTNVSLAVLLDQARKNLEIDLAKDLFS